MPRLRASALVVEDEDQMAHILRFILEREGYEVHLARDGRTAQKLIGSMPPPAIAIMGVMLPHLDGYQLLTQLRGTAGWQAVPVILLTALAQEKDIARGLEAGANDYVLRPFKPQELRARIRRLVTK